MPNKIGKVSSEAKRIEILEDVKEYIRLAPRKDIVNKTTREYTPLLYKDIRNIFKNHGVDVTAKYAIADYMDRNFILRT